MKLMLLLVSTLTVATGAAQAGAPTDAVIPFYETIGLEREASARERFVDPAKAVLDANDALQETDPAGCLDVALSVDGQDYDEAEITKTLKYAEKIEGDNAVVFASFKLFSEPRKIEWKLKRVAGEWKISDIASLTNEWALSGFNCE
ncbi:hypothetical protein GA830_09085 [Mesorhizobium sp. NBSH29]|uniref:hypothetical protein n=1 Tax=Mesorhizobium sp. NBSH29 TaxID=2654249 RepID=UPI001896696E|nr:hypothetical protein [Mesorhizobium sp. NBSH29]QPC86872.1 hypothetical protein GA830_09085 [Mesorhizobium sp. NBSH29]